MRLCRQRRFMRDDDKAGAAFAIDTQHQFEHLTGGMPVEIAGGFIGQHAAWLGHQRTRQCSALALATRELARHMLQPFTQADFTQHGGGFLHRLGLGHAPDQQRHGDILQRAEFAQQMVKLVDKAQERIAHLTALGFGQCRHRSSHHTDRSAGGHIQSAQQMQQGALARAGGTDDGDDFTRANANLHIAQHLQGSRPLAVAAAERLAAQHRVIGTRGQNVRRQLTHGAGTPPD